MDFKEGAIILIDKPLTWTSFDVVNKIRSTILYTQNIKKIKVGHAGTLDPLATGLLIVCIGKKTKEIYLFQNLDKEYIATLTLGHTTPSYDAETEIDSTFNIDHITQELLEETLRLFLGKQQQIPPIFSARKVEGKRAYLHARNGDTVEMPPSNINIYNIELLSFEPPQVEIKVQCSKGTYIRTLAHDIGKALDSGAYLSKLQRTRIGNHDLQQAYQLHDFVTLLTELKP